MGIGIGIGIGRDICIGPSLATARATSVVIVIGLITRISTATGLRTWGSDMDTDSNADSSIERFSDSDTQSIIDTAPTSTATVKWTSMEIGAATAIRAVA